MHSSLALGLDNFVLVCLASPFIYCCWQSVAVKGGEGEGEERGVRDAFCAAFYLEFQTV